MHFDARVINAEWENISAFCISAGETLLMAQMTFDF
jgi:hypothetical protein